MRLMTAAAQRESPHGPRQMGNSRVAVGDDDVSGGEGASNSANNQRITAGRTGAFSSGPECLFFHLNSTQRDQGSGPTFNIHFGGMLKVGPVPAARTAVLSIRDVRCPYNAGDVVKPEPASAPRNNEGVP
jgi:hypothetical protein